MRLQPDRADQDDGQREAQDRVPGDAAAPLARQLRPALFQEQADPAQVARRLVEHDRPESGAERRRNLGGQLLAELLGLAAVDFVDQLPRLDTRQPAALDRGVQRGAQTGQRAALRAELGRFRLARCNRAQAGDTGIDQRQLLGEVGDRLVGRVLRALRLAAQIPAASVIDTGIERAVDSADIEFGLRDPIRRRCDRIVLRPHRQRDRQRQQKQDGQKEMTRKTQDGQGRGHGQRPDGKDPPLIPLP